MSDGPGLERFGLDLQGRAAGSCGGRTGIWQGSGPGKPFGLKTLVLRLPGRRNRRERRGETVKSFIRLLLVS